MNTTLINSVSEKHSFETVKLKDATNKDDEINDKKETDTNKSVKKDDPPALHVLAESSIIKTVVSNTACATTTPTNVKSPRMVPLVYIQTPTNLKVPSSTGNTKSNPQIIVNNTQFQISALNKLKTNTSMSSVVLTQTGPNSKPQPIILQKNLNSSNTQTLIPVTVATSTGTKQTFAYLGTIIKPPGSKTSENQIVVPTSHLPAGLVPGPTNQKLLLTPMAMPKLTPRIPLTCSTTTSNQPKLSSLILPMTLSTQLKNTNQSVINFKISNGQLQSDPKGGIKVLCDNKAPDNNNDKDKSEVFTLSEQQSKETDRKKDETKTDKVYELSISEVPTSTTRELSYTISIPGEEDKIIKLPNIKKRTTSTDSKDIKNEKDDDLTQNIVTRTEPQQIQRKVHEISILKKCKIISSESKQDTDNSDTLKNANSDVKPVIPEVRKVNPERRRKSQYTYLRDFDEVVVTSGNAWENKSNNNNGTTTTTTTTTTNSASKVKQFQSTEITFTKLESTENETKEKVKKSMDDVIEIEIVKKEKQEIPQLSSEDDNSIRNLLKWKDGIGILPGSKIRFHTNEFGLIEMLMDEEMEKTKTIKQEDEKPTTGNEILCCKECGTYGMPSEFVSNNFCSKNCKLHALKLETKRAYLQEVKAKRKKKKLALIQKQKIEEFTKITDDTSQSLNAGGTQSDDDQNSNDMLQDGGKIQNYPWQGGKKGFSWSKYLDHVKGKAAPVKLFKDPFPYAKNGFRPGMKLEGIDPQHPSYFCVMSVSEVQGYRIRLHFDGYSENYDFWVNADSMDIFPIGWCEKNNHVLHPPPDFTVAEFNWTTYLKRCKATPAPRQLFAHRAGNSACPHGFRLGMKLEAVDKKNTSLICVATVADLMDNRFLVHFDSWDDIYDYWADPSSPYIHPVGWCDQFGHNLTPPNDYPEPESFTWEKYLKETKALAAPVRAFKQRPSNGFKKDMRLEVVDKRLPSLIRVATVEDVRDHQIKVRFDGWPNKYSYWIDDDSPDIHPAGWCQKTGHPLESPLTPEDVYETFECPTVGCRSIGHVQGSKFATHNNAKDCPYSDENLDGEFQLADRLNLTSSDFVQESVVPVSREPPKDKIQKANSRIGRPPKLRRLTETSSKPEWPSEEDDLSDTTTRKRKLSNRENMTSPVLSEKNKVSEDINCRYKTIINSEYPACPSQQILVKHTHLLNEIIRTNSQDARTWTHDEVAEFVSSLPSCKEHSKLFINHKIDGDAFLMLTQKDLVDILKFKLGPAIKLYNSIVLLRKNINFYN